MAPEIIDAELQLGERVLDLVGHPRGQRPDRLQLLGLDELQLGGLELEQASLALDGITNAAGEQRRGELALDEVVLGPLLEQAQGHLT